MASTIRKRTLVVAKSRDRRTGFSSYPLGVESQGQIQDQPGPRKKVPIVVSRVATRTNQVMIHSGRVTRASDRRSLPPRSPPRAANIAAPTSRVGTAIGQQPKAPTPRVRA